MNRNLFVPILAVIAALALVFTCIFILTNDKPKDLAGEKINELYTQKSKLNYEIDKCRTELEKLTLTKPGAFFHFENLEEALIDTTLPLLEENGNHDAIVKVSPDEYKNSVVFDELEKQGWEFAIGFDDNYSFPENDEEAAAALDNHIKLYGEKGSIPSIISFCSGNASYRRSFDDVLKNNGIKVVIAPRVLLAGGSNFLDYDHENGLLKIPSVPFSVTNTVEATLRTHINSQKPLALSIKHLEDKVPAGSDKLSTDKFKLMLNYLKTNENLHIGTCLPYREYIVMEHDKNIDNYNEILNKITEHEVKIASIEAEIKSLMEKVANG